MSRVSVGGVIYTLNNDGVSAEGYSQVVLSLSTDGGPKGDPGPTGPIGATGAIGLGALGPSGATGPGGGVGPTGSTGLSAYDFWLAAGNVGTVTDFLASLGASFYRFLQMSPQDTWMVTHPLGYFPAVTVIDSAGSVVEGDVAYVSPSELTIEFSAPFAGEAYLS